MSVEETRDNLEGSGEPKTNPRARVPFFAIPRFQRALRLLDAWGWIEHGADEQTTAKYTPRSTGGQRPTSISEMRQGHAIVDKVLDRMGKPEVLRAYLRHRYPRLGGLHIGSIESFVNPAVQEFQRTTGASDEDLGRLMLEREKDLIRRLSR